MNRAIRQLCLFALTISAGISGAFPVKAADEIAGLEGTSWQLVKIQSMDDREYIPTDPRLYTLRFRSENRLVAESDCNRAGATWTQNGGQLTFTELVSTRMMCNPGTLHNRFISSLLGVTSFVRQDGKLYLAGFADSFILELEPLVFTPQ